MPNSSRPFERWSTVATSSANRSGWLSGSTWTAMPILIRRVQAASAAATTSGDDSTERSFWKWISASQTASRPSASAAFICARDSSKAVAWLIPAGASNSVNRPNSIPPSRGERHLSYTRPADAPPSPGGSEASCSFATRENVEPFPARGIAQPAVERHDAMTGGTAPAPCQRGPQLEGVGGSQGMYGEQALGGRPECLAGQQLDPCLRQGCQDAPRRPVPGWSQLDLAHPSRQCREALRSRRPPHGHGRIPLEQVSSVRGARLATTHSGMTAELSQNLTGPARAPPRARGVPCLSDPWAVADSRTPGIAVVTLPVPDPAWPSRPGVPARRLPLSRGRAWQSADPAR